MANEVFKTPDVYVRETDNTFVRDSNNTVFGTGAITLKANQGPVNQRILFTRFQDFQEVFGKPTSTTDYGHFAARLYMSVAPSLYVVRASYGDETYATIQFPRVVDGKIESSLKAGNPYIRLTTTAETNDLINLVKIEDVNNSIDSDYKTNSNNNEYLYTSQGVIPTNGIYFDLTEKKYKKNVFSKAEIDISAGKYIKLSTFDNVTTELYASNSNYQPSASIITTYAPKSNTSYSSLFTPFKTLDGVSITRPESTFCYDSNGEFTGSKDDYKSLLEISFNADSAFKQKTAPSNSTAYYTKVSNNIFFPINVEIPKNATLDLNATSFDTYMKPSSISDITGNNFKGDYFNKGGSNKYTLQNVAKVSDLDKISANSYYDNAIGYEAYDMQKLNNLRVWESNMTLNSIYVSGAAFNKDNLKEVHSIKFTGWEMGDEENWIVAAYQKAESMPNSGSIIKMTYDYFGTNAIEAKDYTPYIVIRYDRYAPDMSKEGLPSFLNGTSFSDRCINLKNATLSDLGLDTTEYDVDVAKVELLLSKGDVIDNDKLFIVYEDANDEKIYTTSVFDVSEVETPTVPVNVENTKALDEKYQIKECVAIPTNQALVMYPDGYTKTCDTDEEPGIGDLEQIKPWCDSSLVIGALGPGKYANDLGVAIVTPDQYDIKALNVPNGFDWRWRFDDEDKNKGTSNGDIATMIAQGADYQQKDKQLIWTQVYKINVYRKPSDKTAEDAWGTGKEAITSNIPIESFLVSNNPKLVDGEGKSLYAPNVINAQSNFIYITRKSVQSMNGRLPKATFGIFPLVGGTDGTKSGLNQKQAALQLYNDPYKANFDLIFNTDAIESFASREKCRGAQIKFAEIAGSRGDALAIVQATSKEAKKLAKAQAEGKGFSFDYPSYVAMYAGYDKYFDPDLSSYVYLPKSVAAAVTEGWIMYNRNPWDAPAGVENGSIEFTTGSQLLNINADELGELYMNNINCSRTMPVYGEVLWGNKTAQKKNTALRSINVRVLMNYIKKNVKQILTPYIFQINTDTTRTRMKNQLVNFLGGIEQQGGCTNSRVRVWCSGEDLMNHIVRVEMGFIPPYTIEYIPVNIVLDSAANTIDILEA